MQRWDIHSTFCFQREKEKGVGGINKRIDKTYQAVFRQVSVRNVCAYIYILKIQKKIDVKS